ncbi:class I SAM-dependent methyltransferase [Algicola sagamiensis]|uniref:class I SAM-dependent methyltransferase n=1 Tax=Algicola sagamiensis TaxID=163869 RepID=UPI00035C65A5|nr:class I SAM-dependent methyltransferase [Algicola sagamiensis]
MDKKDLLIPQFLHEYLLKASLREPEILQELRLETARDPAAVMQIPPEQGQLLSFLVQLIGAKKTLELGTFTGYSTLSVALAMPEDSLTIACDLSEEWTAMAKRYWERAGVSHKIDLRIAPALETLDNLLETGHQDSFDFTFIDADKQSYIAYYERVLRLTRPGGLIAIDNVFLFGEVARDIPKYQDEQNGFTSEQIQTVRQLNRMILDDPNVTLTMLPIADGLTLVRKNL